MDRALPILCENCGYDIDSLVARLGAEPGLKCPECSKAIAASLPERRTGTPWQVRPGLRSWWRTNKATLNRPRRHERTLVSLPIRAASLMLFNCVSAALLTTVAIKATGAALSRGWEWRPTVMDAVGTAKILASILALIIAHVPVLWLIGRGRQYPRAWARAWTIVGHASAAALLMPVLAVPFIALSRMPRGHYWGFESPTAQLVWDVAGAVFSFAALVGPLVMFELATWSGFRAMRFANPPRP